MHGPEDPHGLQVTPLLSELREGNMVNNLEDLTRSASEAAADIHRLQDEVRRRPASHTPCSAKAGCMQSTLCCWADTIDSSMLSRSAA